MSRRYMPKVMWGMGLVPLTLSSEPPRAASLFSGGDQADDLLHASPVKALAGIHAGSDLEFTESLFVLVLGHQAGGEGIVILGAGFEPEGHAKFLFRLRQLLGVYQRGAEIMVAQAGFRIERNRFAQHIYGFLIPSGKQQGLSQDAVFDRTRGIDGDRGM